MAGAARVKRACGWRLCPARVDPRSAHRPGPAGGAWADFDWGGTGETSRVDHRETGVTSSRGPPEARRGRPDRM